MTRPPFLFQTAGRVPAFTLSLLGWGSRLFHLRKPPVPEFHIFVALDASFGFSCGHTLPSGAYLPQNQFPAAGLYPVTLYMAGVMVSSVDEVHSVNKT